MAIRETVLARRHVLYAIPIYKGKSRTYNVFLETSGFKDIGEDFRTNINVVPALDGPQWTIKTRSDLL